MRRVERGERRRRRLWLLAPHCSLFTARVTANEATGVSDGALGQQRATRYRRICEAPNRLASRTRRRHSLEAELRAASREATRVCKAGRLSTLTRRLRCHNGSRATDPAAHCLAASRAGQVSEPKNERMNERTRTARSQVSRPSVSISQRATSSREQSSRAESRSSLHTLSTSLSADRRANEWKTRGQLVVLQDKLE